MKTAIEELLDYVKNVHAFTLLPQQLAKIIEENYLPKSKREIRNAFNDGEQNVWSRDRDGNIFEYDGGEDYFDKTFKNN
jgi:hypothetical protein